MERRKKKKKAKSKRIKLHRFTATLELSEKFRLMLPELKCCVKHILFGIQIGKTELK